MSRELSRKELLRGLFDFVRGAGARDETPAAAPRTLARPPGALWPDELYLARCSGCERCIPVCPPGALFMAVVQDGRRVAVLAPERQACVLCTSLPCIAACPDGALLPLAAPRQARMGVAQIDPRRCRTFRGEECDLCVRLCPLSGDAIRAINGKPVVIAAACTGCGVCHTACPERPKAIMVFPERELIPGVRLPRDWPPPRRR